ncbi:MAG: hypothetical protein ACUVXA_08125 [Candidatus Jordarchaeum sp.]|uniref:hypothetical protein n=1 Tax=Candidatus Jordarchaeum sp. TaxID=2823881 RepID=UPI0040491151
MKIQKPTIPNMKTEKKRREREEEEGRGGSREIGRRKEILKPARHTDPGYKNNFPFPCFPSDLNFLQISI